FEHFVNILPSVADLQHLRLETFALAFFADQFHVSQKLHFNDNRSIALAGFASPSRNIEGKMSRAKSALMCFGRRRKQIADSVESLDVCNRVRAWGPADWRLINEHNIVYKFVPGDFLER